MDRKPVELIVILLFIFAFMFGVINWQGSIFSAPEYSNNTNWTNITNSTFIERTTDIYEKINSTYADIELSQRKNPSLFEIIADFINSLLSSAFTMGYMFLYIPTWFQGVLHSLSVEMGIVPAWAVQIAWVVLSVGLIGWFIYFWSGRKA